MTLPLDPVAFSIGPISVHWYGLMYVLAFAAAWLLARIRAARKGWTMAEMDDLVTWAMVGVIIGARLGYVLFYNFSAFLHDPVEIVRVWHGGMSFHGGLLGVVAAMWLWSRRRSGRPLIGILDFCAPLVPTGLFFGRIGNFINSELWGAPTSSIFGIAPVPGAEPRHPSQLYEAGLEGIVLFVIVWTYSSSNRPPGRISGMFALFYGLFRFAIEFVRLPDAHIGYILWGWLTMGQILTLPLIITGFWLLFRPCPDK